MKNKYSVSEVASLLGVNKETLRRWDRNGKFKSKRHPINNYRYYNHEQIQSLVKELQLEFATKKGNSILPVPFFKTDLGLLYNLDVIDFLKAVDSESIDLIFADPPYNISKAEWDSFSSQQQYVD